jgi:hypothetical protein
MLQVCRLSLTHLWLLVSLVQLSLEVVDVALGSNQLILSMLQSGEDIVEVISLEVAAVISPHQLIIQLPNACLQASVLLQKLSVALLDVLDDAVLGLHLTDTLLQTEAQVSAHCRGLLKQGAHVLGIACGNPHGGSEAQGHRWRPRAHSTLRCPRSGQRARQWRYRREPVGGAHRTP